MEESINFLQKINEKFNCKTVNIQTYSPLTLAYIGDDVYDLIVRTVAVERGNRSTNGLHKTVSGFVKAGTQAAMAEALWDMLTDCEKSVYRRGRNAKSYTSAKNASIGDYRKATGLEALIGYLYLNQEFDRILELMKAGFDALSLEI